MVIVRSMIVLTWIDGGMDASSRGSACLIRSTVSMTLAPGCLKMISRMQHLPLSALHQPVLRPIDRAADIAHANRRAIAIGQDDVVVFVPARELVIVVDRERLVLTVDRPSAH